MNKKEIEVLDELGKVLYTLDRKIGETIPDVEIRTQKAKKGLGNPEKTKSLARQVRKLTRDAANKAEAIEKMSSQIERR